MKAVEDSDISVAHSASCGSRDKQPGFRGDADAKTTETLAGNFTVTGEKIVIKD
jgi:hypothetical protein